MGRQVLDSQLSTRESRKRLVARREPYWRLIEPSLHLGYSKGPRGAKWYARYYRDGRYLKECMGIADDHSDADGFEVRSFAQAQDAVRSFRLKCVVQADPERAPLTVEKAVESYLKWFAVERRSLAITRRSFEAHILPVFGHKLVSELKKSEIQKWRDRLIAEPPRKRTRKGRRQAYREMRKDADGVRARKATVNRLLANLKAALNYVRAEGLAKCDPVWRDLAPFRNVMSARIRYLNKEESHRLVNSCPEDFRRLVQGALYTGARYKELTATLVSDYSPDAGSLHLRETKNGKPRHAYLTEQGRAFFDAVTAGRAGGEFMFVKADNARWGNAHQTRRMEDACKAAAITPPVTFHGLRHTYGAGLAMAGVPLQVIANALGHSDTRITEKHYAHVAPSYVEKTIRANLPDFGGFQQGKVVPIGTARRITDAA